LHRGHVMWSQTQYGRRFPRQVDRLNLRTGARVGGDDKNRDIPRTQGRTRGRRRKWVCWCSCAAHHWWGCWWWGSGSCFTKKKPEGPRAIWSAGADDRAVFRGILSNWLEHGRGPSTPTTKRQWMSGAVDFVVWDFEWVGFGVFPSAAGPPIPTPGTAGMLLS